MEFMVIELYDQIKKGKKNMRSKSKKVIFILSIISIMVSGIIKVNADTIIGSNMVNNCEPYNLLHGEILKTLKMGGSTYGDAIRFRMGYTGLSNGNQGEADFNFGGNYKSMSFFVGRSEGAERNANMVIKADGVTVFEKTLEYNAIPQKVKLDLTGVYQLSISLTCSGYDLTYYGLGAINLISNGITRDVVLTQNTLNLSSGNSSAYLHAVVVPNDALDTDVTWSSADSNIATVNQNGLVKGVYGGKTTITVKTHSGGYQATCNVIVDMPYDFSKAKISVKANSVIIKYDENMLKCGEDYNLQVKNNAQKGTVNIIATGTGDYKGNKKISIALKETKIKKCKIKKGLNIYCKIKSQSNINGVQYQLSRNKKFKGKKSTYNAGSTEFSAMSAKLKRNKKYYVRVRTYKEIEGKKCYSAWSKTKSLKTKKRGQGVSGTFLWAKV